jgi:hypothetical protein
MRASAPELVPENGKKNRAEGVDKADKIAS